MGFGDLVSRVLVEMKGDTSDLKAKIKELSGIEKERAKQLLADIEKTNKGWGSAVAALGSVGLAMDTVGKFTDFARSSLKAYGDHMRLTTATAGINIDVLSEAFSGLVSQHDLLTFAAQTSTGVLALNQGQMETLGQAAVALRARGFDLEESLKKLTDAAVKGKVGGLDDLGLSIKEGASRAETLRNMMRELNKVIAESGSTTANTADDIQRASVQWDNMGASIKRASAEMFVSIDLMKSAQALNDKGWADFRAMFPDDNWYKAQANFAKGMNKGRKKVEDSEVIEMPDMDLGGDVRSLQEKRKAAAAKRREEAKKVASARSKDWTDLLVTQLEEDAPGQFGDYSALGAGGPSSDDLQRAFDDMVEKNSALNAKGYGDSATRRNESKLAETFGELEEFNAYAMAFEMLGGAVSSAMNAWIDGSMSAGQAVKKFLADALKGLASQMAVEALKHGAYAIGSLAFGDVRGAGQHAAAAAAFGGAAAAAAVAAKSLGGGGGQASGGGSGGGGGGGSGGSPGGNATGPGNVGKAADSRPIILVVGEHFSDDSPRQRRIKAEETVQRALKERDE
jgi:hypothetical protein